MTATARRFLPSPTRAAVLVGLTLGGLQLTSSTAVAAKSCGYVFVPNQSVVIEGLTVTRVSCGRAGEIAIKYQRGRSTGAWKCRAVSLGTKCHNGDKHFRFHVESTT
jgi:hypothetical protein